MIDIRSIYASIANQAITRACEAHSLHGEFKGFRDAMDKLVEERREVDVEWIGYWSGDKKNRSNHVKRLRDELVDENVVTIRAIKACDDWLAVNSPEDTKNATETIVEANKPKLSSVLGLTWENKEL